MTTIDNQNFVMRSKIKTIFSEELLKLIGSICDTKRIDSSQQKMKLTQQLLKRYEIRFDVLGGATNRLALFIDGYAFKFAMDRQGYKDNLMEFALSRELQPYVSKTYETNGYILVAEPVKTMTMDDFHLRKIDILKTLETLSQDYLLGDVGYVKKNFTNWGIRDDGRVVILDYAYIHRATENLFTCDVCGDGLLTYDSTFSYLRCSNATVCQTKYTYHERKTIQGDQVDVDMIKEVKGYSLKLGPGEVTKSVKMVDGEMIDSNRRTIRDLDDYIKYIQEEMLMLYDDFDQNEAVDLMLDRLQATNEEEIKMIDEKLNNLVGQIEDVKYDEIPNTSTANDYVDGVMIDTMNPKSASEIAEDVKEPLPDVAYAMTEDELFDALQRQKPETKPVEVEVEDIEPPSDGYFDDPLELLDYMRKSKTEKSPYGYDVVTKDNHYPVTSSSKPRNKNRKG